MQGFGLAQGLGASERAHSLDSNTSRAAGWDSLDPTSVATVSFSLISLEDSVQSLMHMGPCPVPGTQGMGTLSSPCKAAVQHYCLFGIPLLLLVRAPDFPWRTTPLVPLVSVLGNGGVSQAGQPDGCLSPATVLQGWACDPSQSDETQFWGFWWHDWERAPFPYSDG